MRIFFITSVGLLYYLSVESSPAFSVRIADWGTITNPHRLTLVSRDLFREAFKMISDRVYILPDLKQTYGHILSSANGTVQLRAYNGFLWNLGVEMSNSTAAGRIRRFLVPKDVNGTAKLEEMITCGECMLVRADSLHFLYEAYYRDNRVSHNSHGKILNGPIAYRVSFQISKVSLFNNKTNTTDCKTEIGNVKLDFDTFSEHRISAVIENTGVLSFIADKLDVWIGQYLNTTILNSIQNTLNNSVHIVSEKHPNLCAEFFFH